MDTSEMVSAPLHDFMESAQKVRSDIQHIDRLERRAAIVLCNMKAADKVDIEAFYSIVSGALKLRLISLYEAEDMRPDTIDGVAAAFEFIKLNTKQIVKLAWADPNNLKLLTQIVDPLGEMADPHRALMKPLEIPLFKESSSGRRHFQGLGI